MGKKVPELMEKRKLFIGKMNLELKKRIMKCLVLFVCLCLVAYAFVPHLVNQHVHNLFSLWAASIYISILLHWQLVTVHFILSLHLLVSLWTLLITN